MFDTCMLIYIQNMYVYIYIFEICMFIPEKLSRGVEPAWRALTRISASTCRSELTVNTLIGVSFLINNSHILEMIKLLSCL